MAKMSREEINTILRNNIGRSVCVTFTNEESRSMIVTSVNNEGFVNKVGEEFFWAIFEDVSDVLLDAES